jgi:hypothetical protein
LLCESEKNLFSLSQIKYQVKNCVMTPRPVPFNETPGGWHRWNSRGQDGQTLVTLLNTGAIHAGMAALDVQIAYPQFQVYKPETFSKNLSRIRQDINLRTSGAPRPVSSAQGFSGMPHQAHGAPFGGGVPPVPPVPPPPPPAPVGGGMPPPPPYSYAASGVPFAAATPMHTASGGEENESEEEELKLPYVYDTWDNSQFVSGSLQVLCLTGMPMKWKIEGTQLVGRFKMSKNFTDPDYALGKFRNSDGSASYPENHVRRVARQSNIREMKNPDGDALLVMRVELGRKMAICNQDGFKKKFIMFTGNGETYLFMNLIEEGAVVDETNRYHAPPSHVSVATGAQRSNMDDITTAFSRFDGPRGGNQRRHGDSTQYTFMTVDSTGTPSGRTASRSHHAGSGAHVVPPPAGFGGAVPAAVNTATANPHTPQRETGPFQQFGTAAGYVTPEVAAAAAAGASAEGDDPSINSRSRAPKRSRNNVNNENNATNENNDDATQIGVPETVEDSDEDL